jgi:hypothetical protein
MHMLVATMFSASDRRHADEHMTECVRIRMFPPERYGCKPVSDAEKVSCGVASLRPRRLGTLALMHAQAGTGFAATARPPSVMVGSWAPLSNETDPDDRSFRPAVPRADCRQGAGLEGGPRGRRGPRSHGRAARPQGQPGWCSSRARWATPLAASSQATADQAPPFSSFGFNCGAGHMGLTPLAEVDEREQWRSTARHSNTITKVTSLR